MGPWWLIPLMVAVAGVIPYVAMMWPTRQALRRIPTEGIAAAD